MKPSSLQPRGHARFQEQTFSFHLTPTQASAIAQSSCRDAFGRQDFKKQIQLRFSLLGMGLNKISRVAIFGHTNI